MKTLLELREAVNQAITIMEITQTTRARLEFIRCSNAYLDALNEKLKPTPKCKTTTPPARPRRRK